MADAADFNAQATKIVQEGDLVKIIATAPTDSDNAQQTYTLNATLKNGGRVEWNDGVCSKPELC